jgi:hypothetical protein
VRIDGACIELDLTLAVSVWIAIVTDSLPVSSTTEMEPRLSALDRGVLSRNLFFYLNQSAKLCM